MSGFGPNSVERNVRLIPFTNFEVGRLKLAKSDNVHPLNNQACNVALRTTYYKKIDRLIDIDATYG